MLDLNRKYNTIVIDPPWNIKLTGKVKRRENRAEALPYNTLSIEKIKSINVPDVCEIGAHVYLWTTNSTLFDAYEILKHWGIRFHLMLTMVKPSGIAPCMGYQFATEFCLLGFYGKPMQKFLSCGKKNWLQHQNHAGKHSTKPDSFYDLVKSMSPSPRLDVFARSYHPGFQPWGDEAPILRCECGEKFDFFIGCEELFCKNCHDKSD